MSNMQKTYPSKGDCVSFQIYLILYHIVHKCTVVSCLPGQKISPTPTTGEQNSLKRDPILMSQSRQMGVDLRTKSVTFTSDWEGGVERAKCEALEAKKTRVCHLKQMMWCFDLLRDLTPRIHNQYRVWLTPEMFTANPCQEVLVSMCRNQCH